MVGEPAKVLDDGAADPVCAVFGAGGLKMQRTVRRSVIMIGGRDRCLGSLGQVVGA